MSKSINSQFLLKYFIIAVIAFLALALIADQKLEDFKEYTNEQYVATVKARACRLGTDISNPPNSDATSSPSTWLTASNDKAGEQRYIIDKDGVILAQANVEENQESKYIVENTADRKEILQNDKVISKYTDNNGTKRVAFSQTIRESPGWKYVLSSSEKALYYEIQKLKYTLLTSLALCFILMSFLIYYFSNRITRPIVNLKEVFTKAGEGNFHIRADETTPNEIGEAARGFNRMLAKIKELTYKDNITNLNNFNWFLLDLSFKTAYRRERKGLFALALISIDDFKRINGIMGYEGGNEALRILSKKLLDIIEPGEMVARYYGDEFIILLWEKDRQALEKRIQYVSKICSETIEMRGNTFKLKSSIGARIFPRSESDSYDKLINQATLAKIMVKRRGGNDYLIYNHQINSIMLEEQKLEAELEKALERKQFYLVYQPVVDVDTREIRGVEALLRWSHPVYGKKSIFPVIQKAEQTGLILDIGQWVLKQACLQNKKWQEEGYDPISISVNISSLQLEHCEFVEMVQKTLQETKLDPHLLELEITETIAMENVGDNLIKMKELKALGVRIAIDDFGTGYSSLAYLSQLPIDKLKVDRSFIKDVPESVNSVDIVDTIIHLSQSMHIQVTAEGVETEHQYKLISKTGCDLVQGYLISKPCKPEIIEQKFL